MDSWARGKTAEEILGIARKQNEVIQNYIQTGNTGAQPQYQPPAQQTYQQGHQYQNQQQGTQQPQYDPEAPLTIGMLQQLAPQFMQGQQQDAQKAIEMAASGNLESVRREFSDDFSRWGPEIYGSLAGIRKADWTVENLRKVVRFVRADHVDEIARAQAERLVAERPGSEVLRSTGGSVPVSGAQPNASFSLAGDKLPPQWKARALAVGLTDEAVLDFCKAHSMTPEQMFGSLGKNIITEVSSTDPNARIGVYRTDG